MIFPSTLTSWGSIDGTDILFDLNFIVEEGLDSFLALPEPKEVYSYTWPDEGGTEYDLNSPFVAKARSFSIKGIFVAENEDELKRNISNWKSTVNKPFVTIYSRNSDESFTAKLKGYSQNIKSSKVYGPDGELFLARLSAEFDEITGYIGNLPPIISSGGSVTIKLPTEQFTSNGASVIPRSGSSIASTVWAFVSGPTTVGISDPDTLNPTFTGLSIAGTYVFRLTAIDSNGLSSSQNKTIIVSPEDISPSGFPYTLPITLI